MLGTALATLSAAEVGVYGTAATVLPVLLLAYLLQLATVAQAVALNNVAAEIRKLTDEGTDRIPPRTLVRLYVWWPARGLVTAAWLIPAAAERAAS